MNTLAMPLAFSTEPAMNYEFRNFSLFVISLIACILGSVPLAQAANHDLGSLEALGLSFELDQKSMTSETTANEQITESDDVIRLRVPTKGLEPPVGRSDQTPRSAGSNSPSDLPPPPANDVSMEAGHGVIAPLPEPSPLPPSSPTDTFPDVLEAPRSSEVTIQAMMPSQSALELGAQRLLQPPASADGILDFSLPGDVQRVSTQEPSEARSQVSNSANRSSLTAISPEPSPPLPPNLEALFRGGVDSLVARAVGSAEGTRTPTGDKTSAYAGHTDPGNGVWNLGTFSYQHGASSPQEADQRQINRLRQQTYLIEQQAKDQGLILDLEATLNGIDLANQSPAAALNTGGYVERLKQAYDMGLTGSEAVLWARTRSFLDPDTQRWNAPGLGNTVDRISADQERRQQAIARAIDAQPHITTTDDPLQFERADSLAVEDSIAAETPSHETSEASIIDQILSLDLW